MAKLLLIFLIPCTLIACASQAQAYSDFPFDSTFEVFSVKGNKGLKTESGNIVLKPSYQAFGWSENTTNSNKEFIGYKKKGLWGLMSSDLKLISKPQYNSLLPFSDDLFIVSKKSKYSKVLFYGLIKANGKYRIKPRYRNIYSAGDYLIAATKKEEDITFGIINSSEKVIIPFDYFHIRYLGNNNFILNKENGKRELLNLSAKPQVMLQNIDSVSQFKDGVAILFKNGKQGLIRQDGKILLPLEFKKIDWNEGKHIYVTPLDKWSVIDKRGEELSHQMADSVFFLNDSLIVKNTSSFAQITNLATGEDLTAFNAQIIGVFGDKFILKKANQYFLAKDSTEVQSQKFMEVVDWSEKYFVAKKKTYEGYQYVITNKNGKSISADSAYISEDFIALKMKSFWGIFNKNLNEIIPPIYDQIIKNDDEFIVKFKSKYGLINKNNDWIIPPQYLMIESISDQYYKLVDKYLGEYISNGQEKVQAAMYYDFYGNYGVERNNQEEFRLIDKKGAPLSRFALGKYSGHGKTGIVFRNEDQHLMYDQTGDLLFQINNYDTLILTDDKYFPISKNGGWGFINQAGILRIANRYDTVRSFYNDRSAIKIRNSWGFINRKEEIVIQPYYASVSDFENGTAFVQFNGKFGVVDVDGDFVVEAKYDEILKLNDFYLLRKGLKWGICKLNGKVISYPFYDHIRVLENFIEVEKYGTVRILLDTGKSLIDNQYNEVYYDEERQLFLAKKVSKQEQVFLTNILRGDYP